MERHITAQANRKARLLNICECALHLTQKVYRCTKQCPSIVRAKRKTQLLLHLVNGMVFALLFVGLNLNCGIEQSGTEVVSMKNNFFKQMITASVLSGALLLGSSVSINAQNQDQQKAQRQQEKQAQKEQRQAQRKAAQQQPQQQQQQQRQAEKQQQQQQRQAAQSQQEQQRRAQKLQEQQQRQQQTTSTAAAKSTAATANHSSAERRSVKPGATTPGAAAPAATATGKSTAVE